MKVWIVTRGDGSDGDPTQVAAVFREEELAQAYLVRARRAEFADAPEPVRHQAERFGFGNWDVEEWIARDTVPDVDPFGFPLDEAQPEPVER